MFASARNNDLIETTSIIHRDFFLNFIICWISVILICNIRAFKVGNWLCLAMTHSHKDIIKLFDVWTGSSCQEVRKNWREPDVASNYTIKEKVTSEPISKHSCTFNKMRNSASIYLQRTYYYLLFQRANNVRNIAMFY